MAANNMFSTQVWAHLTNGGCFLNWKVFLQPFLLHQHRKKLKCISFHALNNVWLRERQAAERDLNVLTVLFYVLKCEVTYTHTIPSRLLLFKQMLVQHKKLSFAGKKNKTKQNRYACTTLYSPLPAGPGETECVNTTHIKYPRSDRNMQLLRFQMISLFRKSTMQTFTGHQPPYPGMFNTQIVSLDSSCNLTRPSALDWSDLTSDRSRNQSTRMFWGLLKYHENTPSSQILPSLNGT